MAFNVANDYAQFPGQASGGAKPAVSPFKTSAPPIRLQEDFANSQPQVAFQPSGAPSFTASLERPSVSARTTDPFENDNPFASFGGFGVGGQSQRSKEASQGFANADLSGFFNQGGLASGTQAGGFGSINESFQKTDQNQNFVRDLLLGNQFADRFSNSPIGRLAQQLALDPQGLSEGSLSALQRRSSETIAGAADQASLDASNQLAARGFGESAVAPRIQADIRQNAARDVESAMQSIGIQNEQLAQSRQQQAMAQFQQLLALEQQAQQQAAQTIGNFQFPFVQGAGASASIASPQPAPQAGGGAQPQDAVMQRLYQEQLARQRATPQNPFRLIGTSSDSTISAGY